MGHNIAHHGRWYLARPAGAYSVRPLEMGCRRSGRNCAAPACFREFLICGRTLGSLTLRAYWRLRVAQKGRIRRASPNLRAGKRRYLEFGGCPFSGESDDRAMQIASAAKRSSAAALLHCKPAGRRLHSNRVGTLCLTGITFTLGNPSWARRAGKCIGYLKCSWLATCCAARTRTNRTSCLQSLHAGNRSL